MCNNRPVLEQLARNKEIRKWVQNITINEPQFREDLFQELFLILANMNDEKLKVISRTDEDLKKYIKDILFKLMYGRGHFVNKFKNPFYKKSDHIKYDENGDEIDGMDFLIKTEIDDLVYDGKSKEPTHRYLDALDNNIPKLNRFEREILETYLKEGTIQRVVETKKVNKRYVHGSLVRAKQHLKELIQKELSTYE